MVTRHLFIVPSESILEILLANLERLDDQATIAMFFGHVRDPAPTFLCGRRCYLIRNSDPGEALVMAHIEFMGLGAADLNYQIVAGCRGVSLGSMLSIVLLHEINQALNIEDLPVLCTSGGRVGRRV